MVSGGGDGRRTAKRSKAFGAQRQAVFLRAFASSCDIRAAAAETGVSTATVWAHRRDDARFREAFEAAHDQAVSNLKAELVARGLALLRAATPDEAASAALPGMDAKFLLTLIQAHKRDCAKAPGEPPVKRNDPNEAAARLQALLIRMRLEQQREEEARRLERLERLERKR